MNYIWDSNFGSRPAKLVAVSEAIVSTPGLHLLILSIPEKMNYKVDLGCIRTQNVIMEKMPLNILPAVLTILVVCRFCRLCNVLHITVFDVAVFKR